MSAVPKPISQWDGTGPVPDMWELGDGVPMTDYAGRPSPMYARVLASWSRMHGDIKPRVRVLVDFGPFNFDGAFNPRDARELAAELLRAADQAEAHRLSLSVEREYKAELQGVAS